MTSSGSGRVCLNLCFRLSVLLLGSLALVSSVFAIYSCEFFSYRTLDGQPWPGFEPPFDTLSKASVGLFAYSEMTESGFTFFGDQCINYEHWLSVGQSTMFQVAQWCSIFAPVAGFIAWLQILCESFFCRLRGSYFLIILFFVFASILQACTFLLFADTDFCFEASSQNKCSIKTGAYYSFGSTMAYLILTLISAMMTPLGDQTTCCYGICFLTRETSTFEDDEKQSRSGSETTNGDGLWHSDNENTPHAEANNTDVDGDADGDVDGDEESLNAWPTSSRRESTGRALENDVSTSIMMSMRSMATDADDTNFVTQNSSSKLISFTEEDTTAAQKMLQSQVQQSPPPSAIVKEMSMIKSSTRSAGPPDFFDTVCCGDPLGVEQSLKKSATRKKRMSGKVDSRGASYPVTTFHQGGNTNTYQGGIPVV